MKENLRDLESLVLGEILLLDSSLEQSNRLCNLLPECFTNDLHKSVFNKLYELCLIQNRYVDSVILAQHMGVKHYASKISNLTSNIHSTAYIDFHIEELRFIRDRRIKLFLVKDCLEKVKTSSDYKELEQAQSQIINVLSENQEGNDNAFLNFDKMGTVLKDNLNRVKNSSIDGYSWGIKDLDIISNGIQTSRFIVLGGLKKSGKTRFLIHLMRELHDQNVSVGFLSLEVPEYELYKMILSAFTGIEDTKLRSGGNKYLSQSELSALKCVKLDTSKFLIECKSGLEIAEVLLKIRRMANLGAKVIFIDYLQRVNLDIQNRVNELEGLSIHLANLTRELKISLIVLSQLSNSAETGTPSIAHIKGSGGIAESADTIIILVNPSRKPGNNIIKNKLKVYITQRYGENGEISVYGNLGICKFKDWSSQE